MSHEILTSKISAYFIFCSDFISIMLMFISHKRNLNRRKHETENVRHCKSLDVGQLYSRMTATSLYALLKMGHR